MTRLRLTVSYAGGHDRLKRPPLPAWLADSLQASIMALPAKDAKRSSYVYYRKLYWATPPWLSDEHIAQMKAVYANAPAGFEVDHIVPLKGKRVCGLNVPWNIEAVPKRTNQEKSNHHWPSMALQPVDMFDPHRYEPFYLKPPQGKV